MNKIMGKLFPVLAALSCVVILAGIVLYALLGFNTAAEVPEGYTFEARYDVVLEISGHEADLQTLCEDTFEKSGLSFRGKEVLDSVDSNSFVNDTETVLRYTFAPRGASAETLAKAAETVRSAVETGEAYSDSRIIVSWHTIAGESFGDAAWRGAIAIAVGAIVALLYVGIRFGIASALAGTAACLHNVLFTYFFFAATRIPVYAFAPILYAAVAAAVTVLLWVLASVRMREDFKDPAFSSLTGKEAAAKSIAGSWKLVTFTAVAVAAVIVLFAAGPSVGMAALMLPMLLSVATAVYSVFVIAPNVVAPVKKALDRRKALKKGGYVGKKKAGADDLR